MSGAARTPRSPYPGLRPFERDEDALFFGRDEQVDQLLDKLDETHFLAVLGTSGSGKSSLVRAGLLPALDSGYLAGAGACWAIAELRPGDRPFARLATALIEGAGWGGDSTTDLERDLRRGNLALNWLLGTRPLPEGTRLLILVDQFEELFRYQRANRREAADFVALLLGAASHPDVYLVITLRSEFLGDCSAYADLPEAINRGLFLTPSLTPEQMADAIQLPAALPQFGGEVAPELVRRLLDEARGQTDQLPLLQHTLMRLWDRGDGARHLTLADLEALGGLRQALNDHVEEAFAELNPEQRRIAEVLFRGLTERDTRRPVPLGEIADLAGVDPAAVAGVVEVFRAPGRSFLMPPAETALTRDSVLDITHEALIRQWRRLRDWTADEAERAELYQRLEAAARRHAQGREALWIDPALQIALSWRDDHAPTPLWAARYGGDFGQAMAFLEASRKQRELDAATAEAQRLERTRELFDSRLTHAALLAKVKDYAEARRVLSETVALDPDIPETRRHARNLLAGHVDILGGSADQVYEGAGAALSGGVALSLDGRWLAAAGERGALVLFDAESGALVRRLEGHDPAAAKFGAVRSIAFDPDGRWLVSGGEDGRIIRWSVPDGDKLGDWEAPDRVWALAISPNGRRLASGDVGGKITLWDTETGEQLRTLEGHTSAIAAPNGLDFSPDGESLASASFDETARIWDPETGETLHRLRWHQDALQAVAFSPDGTLIATAADDKRIVLWDAETGQALRLLTGHDNIVFGLAFDAEGRRLLSASRDNTMRLWDVATGVTLRVFQGHTAALSAVARDGDTLYTAANDQTVRRWSLDTPGQWLWELDGSPEAVSVSPDGTLIAVGFANGGLAIHRAPSGEQLWRLDDAHDSNLNRLAFSPDGLGLASAGDSHAKLWHLDRTEAGLELTLLHSLEGHTDVVHAVAFSADGRTLATAGYDGRVGLFDVASGEGELFEAHAGRIATVQFDLHGRHLLSVGIDDFKLRLWDLTKQPPEPREVAKAGDNLLWASLRPDGRQLATVGADMTVRLWDLETAEELFALRLPTDFRHPSPVWDFDFRCMENGDCWIAVPLTIGRLALYRLPYRDPPASIAATTPGP